MGFTNDPTDNTAVFPVAASGGGGGGGTVTLDGPSLAALESIDLNAASLAALETIGLDAASLAALESIEINAASLAALADTRGTKFDQAKAFAFTSAQGVTSASLYGWSFKNTFAGLTEISLFLNSAGTGPAISINLAENETVTHAFPDGLPTASGVRATVTVGTATGLLYVDQAAAAV